MDGHAEGGGGHVGWCARTRGGGGGWIVYAFGASKVTKSWGGETKRSPMVGSSVRIS